MKRREDGPARLEVFAVEQVEALARAAESGAWREPREHRTLEGDLLREEEDRQLLRVAAYTGLRWGELVALRWRDVRWSERVLVVERALSGDVEGTTKGGRVRYVPLGDQAPGALDRLSRRANFTGRDDYVFAGPQQASIDLNGDVIAGKLPRRALAMIAEWAQLHRAQLEANWASARNGGPLEAIDPLP